MKPNLQALVLAEHVYQLADGNGKAIVNTFNGVTLTNIPDHQEFGGPDGVKQRMLPGGISGSPYAFISLTDVVNQTELLMQFVSLKHNVVLFEKSVTIQCSDRLQTVEIIAELPKLPIEEEGVYAFEVVWKGEILGSHRIVAKLVSV